MSLPSEHKALIFVGAVAVLGAGVRVVRASGGPSTPANQPALDHQLASADSSAHAAKGRGAGRGRAGGRGGGHAGVPPAPGDTTHSRRRSGGVSPSGDSARRAPVAALDRQGYIGRRLDLDVATAAQVDSLPGVSPTLAKRIVTDRLSRGPFLNMNGFRRVSGVGPAFIAKVDSLVIFSGTVVQPNAADTVIPRSHRAAGTNRRPMR
jgi:hypothetical protein